MNWGATNLLLGVGPAQLLGHDVGDGGQRLGRGLHVEEGQAQAARDHVHGRAGILAHAVADLRVDVRELGVHLLADDGPALARHGRHLGHGERAVAVRLGQVLGHLERDIADR